MAEWIDFNPLGVGVPGLEEIAETSKILIDALGIALDTMATVVDVVSNFVGNFMDAQQALIDAVNLALDVVIQQLTMSGFYFTFHLPPSIMATLSPAQWSADVANSLFDYSDPRRPVMPTRAFVGGLAFMASANTYGDLMKNYEKFFALMGKLIALADQMTRWPSREDPWVTVPGVGVAPNWASKRLCDIVPPMTELAELLIGFKEIIAGAISQKDLYTAFAELLRSKAEWLMGWAAKLEAILRQLDALLGFHGAWVLPVYGEFTGEELAEYLRSATGGPFDHPELNFSAGAFIMATGGTTPQANADALFSIFGIDK